MANIADDCQLSKQKFPIRPSKQGNGLLQSTVPFFRENAMPFSYHRDAHFISPRQELPQSAASTPGAIRPSEIEPRALVGNKVAASLDKIFGRMICALQNCM